MKIAIFHNLPGGGSVRVVHEMAKYLSHKHQVDIYTITEDQQKIWKNKILQVKESTKIVKPWKGFFGRNLWIILFLWRIHKNLATQIDQKEYDYILINHDYFTKSPYILRFLKTKKIYILHEPPREFYEPSQIHSSTWKSKIVNFIRVYLKFIDLSNTKKADIIISNSKYSQELIQKIYNLNSYVLYPGVDIKKFKPTKFKRSNQILMIGSLKKYKGHYFVVKALSQVLSSGYRIIILGDGDKKDVDFILQQIHHNLHKQITFLDHVDDHKLISLYQKSKILCIGSHREPFGMTSIEAQACGTPVVAVAEGGVVETITDKKTGFLTKRIEKDFLDKTLEILEDWKIFSAQATALSGKWSWDKTFQKLEDIIKNSK